VDLNGTATRLAVLSMAGCLAGMALAGCGDREVRPPNTIAAPIRDPLVNDPLQRDAEANVAGAIANGERSVEGPALDTVNPRALPTDNTTVGPDGAAQGTDDPATERRPPSHKAALLRSDARASFQALEEELGGSSGVAVSAIGTARRPESLGDLRAGPAWSTIKVPIALASERAANGHPSATIESDMRAALTASDNAAAEALWAALGTPSEAGRLVEQQLRLAGDRDTTVQTARLRAEFSPFGQTAWSLGAQARFAAGLACVPHHEPVLTLMGQVQEDQRWGLGSVGHPAWFKGGWGPDLSGRYLVRQFGLVSVGDERVAIAIADKPVDGQFTTGAANLTRLATWAVAHIDAAALSASGCGSSDQQPSTR
jgi:hypothetical protein